MPPKKHKNTIAKTIFKMGRKIIHGKLEPGSRISDAASSIAFCILSSGVEKNNVPMAGKDKKKGI